MAVLFCLKSAFKSQSIAFLIGDSVHFLYLSVFFFVFYIKRLFSHVLFSHIAFFLNMMMFYAYLVHDFSFLVFLLLASQVISGRMPPICLRLV